MPGDEKWSLKSTGRHRKHGEHKCMLTEIKRKQRNFLRKNVWSWLTTHPDDEPLNLQPPSVMLSISRVIDSIYGNCGQLWAFGQLQKLKTRTSIRTFDVIPSRFLATVRLVVKVSLRFLRKEVLQGNWERQWRLSSWGCEWPIGIFRGGLKESDCLSNGGDFVRIALTLRRTLNTPATILFPLCSVQQWTSVLNGTDADQPWVRLSQGRTCYSVGCYFYQCYFYHLFLNININRLGGGGLGNCDSRAFVSNVTTIISIEVIFSMIFLNRFK